MFLVSKKQHCQREWLTLRSHLCRVKFSCHGHWSSYESQQASSSFHGWRCWVLHQSTEKSFLYPIAFSTENWVWPCSVVLSEMPPFAVDKYTRSRFLFSFLSMQRLYVKYQLYQAKSKTPCSIVLLGVQNGKQD